MPDTALVRLPAHLLKPAKQAALEADLSLQAWLAAAVEAALKKETRR